MTDNMYNSAVGISTVETVVNTTTTGGITGPYTYSYKSYNGIVNIHFNNSAGQNPGGNDVVTVTAKLPVGIRPTTYGNFYPISVQNNSINQIGILEIDPDGSIYFYASPAFDVFGNLGTALVRSMSVSYII
jgi:hypothetical protein